MKNLIRKLFLVKEIKSKEGVLHFQRWRLIQCKLFAIYIHYIARSDEDKHPHNHPWNFTSVILKGGYIEKVWQYALFQHLSDYEECFINKYRRTFWSSIICSRYMKDYHQIELLAPTWTLVLTGSRRLDEWGYLTEHGFKNHIEYRKEKNGISSDKQI